VTIAFMSEQVSSINPMSNKKQRLLNKHHFCHMQTPISWKLHKVDDTSVLDLMTEVTALVKNLTGSPPVKLLTQVLIDTVVVVRLGLKKQYVPNGLSNAKKGYANYLEYNWC
jgi:hypothetical protein